jgi:hypothetical protein
MAMSIRKTVFSAALLVLAIAVLSGCANPPAGGSSSGTGSQQASAVSSMASIAPPSYAPQPSSAAAPEDSVKALLLNIQKESQQGKVINCEFPVESTCIEDIQKKWGPEDQSGYVAAAKGVYATYIKKGMVFGYNKGSQIFEARTFDDHLENVSMSKVIEVFGKPAHDVKNDKEEIIGYVINEKYKILFVFPNMGTKDPVLDHYSVFYPQGTVNYMADDPGREW